MCCAIRPSLWWRDTGPKPRALTPTEHSSVDVIDQQDSLGTAARGGCRGGLEASGVTAGGGLRPSGIACLGM